MEWNNIIKLKDNEIEDLCRYQLPELEQKLALLTGCRNFERDLKCGTILDCFINIFQLSKENAFSTDQLSWLLKLQGRLLTNCEQGMTFEQNFESLLESLKLMPTTPSKCKDDLMDPKVIINYLLQCFFQHYNLYKLMFTSGQECLQMTKSIEVEAVPVKQPFPAPLEEAILESLYEEYLNPKPQKEIEAESFHEEVSKEISSENGSNDERNSIDVLLTSLKPDELKNLIKEVADARFSSLKVELEGKINDRESALTKTFNKLQTR